MKRYIQIVKSRGRQKYRATFYADNYAALVKTTERYSNLDDLLEMLDHYFPTWEVKLPTPAKS